MMRQGGSLSVEAREDARALEALLHEEILGLAALRKLVQEEHRCFAEFRLEDSEDLLHQVATWHARLSALEHRKEMLLERLAATDGETPRATWEALQQALPSHDALGSRTAHAALVQEALATRWETAGLADLVSRLTGITTSERWLLLSLGGQDRYDANGQIVREGPDAFRARA